MTVITNTYAARREVNALLKVQACKLAACGYGIAENSLLTLQTVD
ncbi:MAG TPA: hypothetical protein VFE62_25810 [Gemmataceae bacterium]|nr:hypothetical protein [Gemmataceae bacterium]